MGWRGHVLRRPRAVEDIQSHVDHYLLEAVPEVAERFVQAVERGLSLLIRHPQAGSPCVCRSPELQGLRWWPVPGFRNHLIFYRPTGTHLELVRVLHGARDLACIFEIDSPR